VWWLLLALAALVVADRLLLRAEARGWVYYRRHRATSTQVGSAAFGPVFDLIQPTRQVIVEERDRQELMREQAGQDEE